MNPTMSPSAAINPQPSISYTDHLSAIADAVTAMQDQLLREPDEAAEQLLASYLMGQAMYLLCQRRGISHPIECMRFTANLLMMQARKAMPHDEYLTTKHWRTRRLVALDRAEHRCQFCGGTDRLEVHHNSYDNKWNERDADLLVLCHACHARHHGVER